MNHNFSPSQVDATKCIKCRRGPIDHTEFATCEACPNVGKMELWADMLLCPECIQKEIKAVADYQSPELQEQRLREAREREAANNPGVLSMGSILDKAKAIDYQVQVRTDVFNNETVDHISVFKGIDEDSTIPTDQKQFTKAKFLEDRISHYQDKIFGLQSELQDIATRQRAAQQEFNQLANKLREDERKKLKLLSPDYKPGAVKSPKETKPRASKKAQQFDKADLIKQAQALQDDGFPIQWHMLRMTCIAQGMTPVQAANFLRDKMKGL